MAERKTEVTKKCPICGKIFKSWKCHNKKYCSQMCYWKDDKKPSNAKGKKWKDASRKKLSLSTKGRTVWNKGIRGKYKCSEETKKKISKAHTGSKKPWAMKSGKENHNWKGGVTKIDKLCRGMMEYKQWRTDIFKRDSWTCQTCGCRGYVTVHHIKSFSKIIKENNIIDIKQAKKCEELWNLNNGVTLCEECHKLTDNYAGRGINKAKKK